MGVLEVGSENNNGFYRQSLKYRVLKIIYIFWSQTGSVFWRTEGLSPTKNSKEFSSGFICLVTFCLFSYRVNFVWY